MSCFSNPFFFDPIEDAVNCLLTGEGSFERKVRLVDSSLLNQKVDQHFKTGDTLLHLATKKQNYEACKSLLEKGANMSIKDVYGKTALDYALESGDKKLIALFLEMQSVYKEEDVLKSRKRVRELEVCYTEVKQNYEVVRTDRDRLAKKCKVLESDNNELKTTNTNLRRSSRLAEKREKEVKVERDNYKKRYETLKTTAFKKKP